MTGLGNLHHPSPPKIRRRSNSSTGLRLIYAFNHDEAARSFQRAADLDPKLPMAYWGVAEAVGPNYNDPASDERFAAAHNAIQKAVDLAANASPAEQGYIQAMALRFPADPKADRREAAEAYHDAMRELTKNFPDDLDAATLFAESGMNLHPWGLWHRDGTPEAGTEEIVATLESVIKRDPNHMGAIHYYIHASGFGFPSGRWRAEPPGRDGPSQNIWCTCGPRLHSHRRLRSRGKDQPGGAIADRAYIKASGAQGLYPMILHYNLHFIAMCHERRLPEAMKNAQMLAAHVRPGVKAIRRSKASTIPIAVDVRFHRWDDMKMPKPDPK
jgi:tetratricopeptide (TPR) repeat protein